MWTLALLLVGVCSAAPMSKIVGGSNATPNDWPWQISLQFQGSTGGYGHICGASLISENYALTAAHCVSHDPTVSKYRLLLGEHQFSVTAGTEQTITLSNILMHPQYSDSAGGFPHDIAILRLSSPAKLNEFVKVATLPTSTSTSFYNGRTCYITGWGRLSGGGSLPDTLQEAQTTVISHSNCRSALGMSGLLYLQEGPHVCVYTGSNGACNGDSGGPLVCDVNGVWELAGATSWGLQNCPTSSPTVYTRVSNYLSWIRQNTDL
ncbi:elastase-1-like [Saccostrea cucullata]|uniref:elastase-1-like n=1 Tax=Saccostrea cuccullata TaxID=36930 RepID=UPI002ED130AF